MEKNLNYYLRLPYKIELLPIPEEDGGGFTASLPEIGKFAVVGDGATPGEAIEDLENAKRQRFAYYLEKGIDIPEPSAGAGEEEYEGRFVIRFPQPLCREIASYSRKIGMAPDEFIVQSVGSVLKEKCG